MADDPADKVTPVESPSGPGKPGASLPGSPIAPAGAPAPANTSSSRTQPRGSPGANNQEEDDDDDDDDDGYDDVDSAFGDDVVSSTASLTASILEYRTLHGRTYHSLRGNADYWAANDERQSETMDMVHHIYTILLGDKLHIAPIGDDPKKVLDIGTGTGIWAIDFADQFPNCQIIGTDISPNQPQWVPPNVKFEIDDCTQEWTYEPESFDFVHIRLLFGSIPDWDALYSEAFKVLKPGGWIEVMETSVVMHSDDDSVVPGMALHDWGPLFHQACNKVGRSMRVVDDDIMPGALERAGFVSLDNRKLKMAMTPWPADRLNHMIGYYAQWCFLEGMEGYALHLFINVLGWSREEVHVYLARVRKEMKSRVSPWSYVQVICAQKPTI